MTRFFFTLLCLGTFALHSIGFGADDDAKTATPSAKKETQQVETKKKVLPNTPSLKEEPKTDTDEFFDFDGSPTSYQGAFIKMMLTLLGLIVLIVITVWLLRRVSHGRLKQSNYGRSIKVLERRPLSAKSVLYLVDIGGKSVVIAESQVEVRAITEANALPSTED